MSQIEQFQVLIVDSDTERRMRLRAACSSVITFQKSHQFKDTKDALLRMGSNKDVCVVFVSSTLGPEKVSEFIKEARTTPYGDECAYIVTMKSEDQSEIGVAKALLSGIDGMLCEPYSVDNLVEISRLGVKIKHEAQQKKQIAGIEILIRDFVEIIDEMSVLAKNQLSYVTKLRQLNEATDVLKSFDENVMQIYFEQLCDLFGATKVPEVRVTKYEGASQRIRLKLEKDEAEKRKALEEQARKEGGAPARRIRKG